MFEIKVKTSLALDFLVKKMYKWNLKFFLFFIINVY